MPSMLFCLFLDAFVADCHNGPPLAVKCERRAGHLDRELAAVLTRKRVAQVTRRRLHARARVPGEFVATRAVSISVPGLHEHLDGPADELAARVTGQDPETFVRVTDHAVLVHEGDPFGHLPEQVV